MTLADDASNLAPAEEAGHALLVFQVGHARLAVPAPAVEAITDRAAATPLPRAPEHVAGLMAFRGKPLPLVLLVSFLGLPRSARDERHERVVVVAVDGMQVGLCCDGVDGIAHVAAADLAEPEVTVGGALGRYARAEIARDGGLVVALALPALLADARPRGTE